MWLAAGVLVALGARSEFCKVAHPNVDTSFEELNFMGERDRLRLCQRDQHVHKHFFDIYGALTDPSTELNHKVLIKVATLVLRCMTTVSFSKLLQASKNADGHSRISATAVNIIYN